jgi:predicted nucleic acid-binding protein
VAYLVDTSILGRLANTADADYSVAVTAVLELHRRGETLHLAPQNLIEFRNVATRPVTVNGLGLSAADAEAHAAKFEAVFPLLPETPDIYPTWKSLVHSIVVIGKQVHDVRLVAICHVHGITHLLTFNAAHFARLAGIAPGVIVVEPAAV